MLDKALFTSWINKEKRVLSNKKRSYPHFDRKFKINQNIQFFRSYFSKEENVAEHSFYPFIKSDLSTPRYKKTDKVDEKGKAIRVLEKKVRPLAYASHFDAFIYSWYSHLLTERYTKIIKQLGIQDCVLAYISTGKSNIDYAHETFEEIRGRKECVALAFDISSFFDGLDHEHLKKMWCKVLNKPTLPRDHFNVYKSLTSYTSVLKQDLEQLFPESFSKQTEKTLLKLGIENERRGRICSPKEFREHVRGAKLIQKNPFFNNVCRSKRYSAKCGIPQGSPISACLSNIYMIEFDVIMKQLANELNGSYRRYCDDIIFVVDQSNASLAKEVILSEIINYHLEINTNKTDITVFKEDSLIGLRGFEESDDCSKYKNLQYLGFEFNGQNVYIRSSSMSRYKTRKAKLVRETLKSAYGKNAKGDKIYKEKLYKRSSEKGSRNFISYAERAAETMSSETIKKQHKNSIPKVKRKLESKKKKFEQKLKEKGLFKKSMN